MKRPIKISGYQAARLWRLSDKFYRAEKKYRDAQKEEIPLRDALFHVQQERHLAKLDCLSAGREMSDILYGALQDYFCEPDDNHDD